MSVWDRIDKKHKAPEIKLECLACGTTVGVTLVPSQTLYSWDGTGDDPNRPAPLCKEHGDEYTEEMRAKWADYYSSCL